MFPAYQKLSSSHESSYLDEYEAALEKTRLDIEAIQLKKLRALLVYAGEHSPYYQRVFRDAGFDPKGIKDVSELEELPLLTKQIVSDNYDDLACGPHRRSNIRKSTGGSTGQRHVE